MSTKDIFKLDEQRKIVGLSRREFLRVLAGGASIVVVGPLLSACRVTPTTAPAAEIVTETTETTAAPAVTKKTGRVAHLVLQRGALRYNKADIPFFVEAAKKRGYETLVHSAEGDLAKQVSQFENVLTVGVDGISFQPVDATLAASIIEKANKAGIPVISYNDLAMNSDVIAYVSYDVVWQGELVAEEVVKAAPTGNYILSHGDEGSSVARDTAKGFHNILDPLVEKGDIKIVSEAWSPGWTNEPVLKQVENALTANNNDIQAILTGYDAMAMAAIQALATQGLEGKVPVTGMNAELQGLQAIAEGRMFLTVFEDYGQMGQRAANALIDFIEGKFVPPETTLNNGLKDVPRIDIDILTVTKEKLPEFLKEHPWWMTVEEVYANVPKEEWPEQ